MIEREMRGISGNRKLKVLYIHGMGSSPAASRKAQMLRDEFEVEAVEMNTLNYVGSLLKQIQAVRRFQPDVVIGCSFGGAIATHLIQLGEWRGPTVLLCQATGMLLGKHKLWLPKDVFVTMVHGTADTVIPVEDSRKLAASTSASVYPYSNIENDHDDGNNNDRMHHSSSSTGASVWNPTPFIQFIEIEEDGHPLTTVQVRRGGCYLIDLVYEVYAAHEKHLSNLNQLQQLQLQLQQSEERVELEERGFASTTAAGGASEGDSVTMLENQQQRQQQQQQQQHTRCQHPLRWWETAWYALRGTAEISFGMLLNLVSLRYNRFFVRSG